MAWHMEGTNGRDLNMMQLGIMKKDCQDIIKKVWRAKGTFVGSWRSIV